jgi:predicted nucleic acid-binding Zn ribbon protein
MHGVDSSPEVSAESARALVAAPGRECPGCGRALTDRQKGACSGKCRAKLSRQRQAAALQTEVQLLRARLDALAERVDRMTQRSPRRRDPLQTEFEALPLEADGSTRVPPTRRREIIDLALDVMRGPEGRAKAGACPIL